MAWPPRVGETLPRGADAWFEQPKWVEWILSARGHGPEWRAILRIGSEDAEALWEAISLIACASSSSCEGDQATVGI
jgi:hypothetical protein